MTVAYPVNRAYILGDILCPKCLWTMWSDKVRDRTGDLIWIVNCVNRDCNELNIKYRVRPSIDLALEPK